MLNMKVFTIMFMTERFGGLPAAKRPSADRPGKSSGRIAGQPGKNLAGMLAGSKKPFPFGDYP